MSRRLYFLNNKGKNTNVCIFYGINLAAHFIYVSPVSLVMPGTLSNYKIASANITQSRFGAISKLEERFLSNA